MLPVKSIQHWTCKGDGGGSPEFKPTKRLGTDEFGNEHNPEDKTVVFQCEKCRTTIGVEPVEDGLYVVYI